MTAVAGAKSQGAPFTNNKEVIRVVYDFAADGGATGVLDLLTAQDNIIITDLHAHVLTACTSGGSATVEVGITGATASLMAQTAVANLTANACIGFVGPVRVAKDAAVQAKIATAALTAGKIEFTFTVMRAAQ